MNDSTVHPVAAALDTLEDMILLVEQDRGAERNMEQLRAAGDGFAAVLDAARAALSEAEGRAASAAPAAVLLVLDQIRDVLTQAPTSNPTAGYWGAPDDYPDYGTMEDEGRWLLAEQIRPLLTNSPAGALAEAQAEALEQAAHWLNFAEEVGTIAFDGPSNRAEVVAAYEAAIETPDEWLRERARDIRARAAEVAS